MSRSRGRRHVPSASAQTPRPTVPDALPRKMNVGCGRDVRPGWLNVDREPIPGVFVWKLEETPWPFPDDHFELIHAEHVLEHVSRADGALYRVIEELARVLQPGGTLVVKVPHHQNIRRVWMDPTHVGPFTPDIWDYWSKDRRPIEYGSRRLDLVSAKVTGWDDRAPGLKLRGLALASHIRVRLPSLSTWVAKPAEMTYVVRKPTS